MLLRLRGVQAHLVQRPGRRVQTRLQVPVGKVQRQRGLVLLAALPEAGQRAEERVRVIK